MQERVMKCGRRMREMGLIRGEFGNEMCSDSKPRSPVDVLERLPSVITRSDEAMEGTSSSIEFNKRRRL